MKKVIVALLMVSSVSAIAATGYTAEVCQTNEAGAQVNCRMIHFNRDLGVASKYNDQVICDGEAQNTICEKPAAHVPVLLQKINKFFKDRGFTAPVDRGDEAGG